MVIFAETETSLPAVSLDLVRLDPTTHTTRGGGPESNGITLHYANQGPKTGPAVVLLHGYTDSWFSFSRVLPLLPSELRVIAPDQRGHGDSERPLQGYRTTDLADDVIRMMDALDVPKAVIVGHSMGSFVARKVCQAAPHRVSRLVLVGAGPTALNDATRGLAQLVSLLSDPVDEQFVREFQMSTVHAPVPEAFIETVIANSRRMPARVWKAMLAGLLEDEVTPLQPQVRTLVLGGRQDSVFPASEQMVLARQFPRGELQLVDGVGHSLHWEMPKTFVNALIRFGV